MFVKIHTDSDIKEYRGYTSELSTPPEGVKLNDTFFCMDTQQTYYWNGSKWVLQELATKQYVDAKVPPAPTKNGTYTLKVTVSNGTATYSWVNA